jgi:hypothetical protein
MAVVSLEKIQAGEVLAADVHDSNGRLLIPAGKELADKHLNALRMWGVSHCEIEGDGPDEDETAEIDPAVLEEARGVVEALFVHNDPLGDHPVVALLREAALLRTARELASRQVEAVEPVEEVAS